MSNPKILILVEGGCAEVVCSTIAIDVTIIDKDQLKVGERGEFTQTIGVGELVDARKFAKQLKESKQ